MLTMGHPDFPILYHIGEPLPSYILEYETDIFMLQADSKELDYIKRRFPGMIIPLQPVVTWYGQMAKNIAASL